MKKTIMISLLCLAFSQLSAQGVTSTVVLEQIHFVVNPDSMDISEYLVFEDLEGSNVPMSQISTQITDRILQYCTVIFPSFSIREVAATNFLGSIVEMPEMTVQGSVGLGTATLQGTQSPELLSWVQALPVNDIILASDQLSHFFFLELIDRLSQFLDIKTGVLEDGSLIFGSSENWVTNYTPSYTLELSERYSE